MACFAVVKHREDDPGRPFGPFLTRDDAEEWIAGEFPEEGSVSFFDVDDFIAFGAEVN